MVYFQVLSGVFLQVRAKRRKEWLRAPKVELPDIDGIIIKPKNIQQSDTFITQETYFKLMDHYNETLMNLRSFPTRDMHILARYKLDTCAGVWTSVN